MLYRLDTNSGPVCDLFGPRLIRRYALARTVARDYADRTGEDVTVTRIGPSGHLSHALTVQAVTR